MLWGAATLTFIAEKSIPGDPAQTILGGAGAKPSPEQLAAVNAQYGFDKPVIVQYFDYIGGLLRHAPSLLAFTNPTVNSYHRLVPGFEAPVNLVYSQRNRSACIRIPITGANPKAKRIEFRAPDASGNPYLAFAAQLMAGLDGIQNRIEPHEPVDKDLYELPPEEAKNIPQVPNSLLDSLEALRADHEFLLKGGVFTPELIETWIEYKIENEIQPLNARPHPFEYELYFGV